MQQAKSSLGMSKLSRCPQTKQLLIKHLMRAVNILTVCACLISSVVFSAFPANADTVQTVVDLTKEQTLALYGNTIQGRYYTGSEWRACSFEYFASSVDFVPVGSTVDCYITDYQNLNYSSSSDIDSLYRNNEFLYYRCELPSPEPTGTTSSTGLQFDLDFSVQISGIGYFRQIVSMAKISYNYSYQSTMPIFDGVSVQSVVSYSGTPIQSNARRTRTDDLANGYYITPIADSGVIGAHDITNAAVFLPVDVYLWDVDQQTGLEREFSVSGQSFQFNRAAVYWLPENYNLDYSDVLQDAHYYYVIAISTPRVTDGYVLPEPDETAPNYSDQIDTIISTQGTTNTLLQQILAKLDLIYQKMQGGLSPNLSPAQTIPPTLQNYYSGVASGAPSASAVNGAIGDASDFVPFSAILSSSGLGSLLGVLAGLCCAGWVLTRGRSG